MKDAPHFHAVSRQAWREWLEQNHAHETGVWLVYDKGAARTISWQDIVKEALCFGWIDGRANKVSDTQSKIYVSKRKPRGMWSKINKQNVEELIAAGLMTPAGMKAIETAKENGSWQALELSDNLVHPPELIEAFEASPQAKEHFMAFPASSQRNTLQWIYDAKTEPTKMRRVEQVVEAAKDNKRVR